MTPLSFNFTLGLLGAIMAVPMLVLGIVFIKMGHWPKRRGSEPHCRKCDYLLVGIESERCPECGADIKARNRLLGTRHRHSGLTMTGATFLLLGAVSLVPLVVYSYRGVDWYQYRPTPWVTDDMRSGSRRAWTELTRRDASGRLSAKQSSSIVDFALAQQLALRSHPLLDELLDFASVQYDRKHLTDAQSLMLMKQSTQGSIQVRSVIVAGSKVRGKLVGPTRVPGRWQPMANVIWDECRLDGVPIGNKIGRSPFSDNFSFECSSLGEHTLEMPARVQMRDQRPFAPGPVGGNVIYEEGQTFGAHFRVVADPPTDDVKLIEDAALGEKIRASIKINRVESGRSRTVSIQVIEAPIDFAFDIIVRSNGSESSVGSLILSKRHGLGMDDPPVAALTSVDVILRSSQAVARTTADINEIWKGELLFTNVPVVTGDAAPSSSGVR